MASFDVYQDIATRTGGDIYIGVVGPVRTGKSTFIKRFMEVMVLPNIREHFERERAQDELPQSGTGRTITTTEPKFIPGEAVTITLNDKLKMNVRMVDCVGYTVDGALGYAENEIPRMVRTPWSDDELTFQQAAEMGTQKVINEHATLGVVVITDGSITDLERSQYLAAEQRVINELKSLGKPFVIILNTTRPFEDATENLAKTLERQYQAPVIVVDCLAMQKNEVQTVLEKLLYMFPIREIGFELPRWLEELGESHWLFNQIKDGVWSRVQSINRVFDVEPELASLHDIENIKDVQLVEVNLGDGSAIVRLSPPVNLYYNILSEMSGLQVNGEHDIMRMMKDLAVAKKEYDRISKALEDVRETGYGVVFPGNEDIEFDEPELIRQGHRFGVRLRASAPSIHMIRANINTTVSPLMGTEKQGEDFVQFLTQEFENDPAKIWQTDFMGKSMYDLVKDGIQSKLTNMPENAQEKLQETLTKIINEGSGGLICIII